MNSVLSCSLTCFPNYFKHTDSIDYIVKQHRNCTFIFIMNLKTSFMLAHFITSTFFYYSDSTDEVTSHGNQWQNFNDFYR